MRFLIGKIIGVQSTSVHFEAAINVFVCLHHEFSWEISFSSNFIAGSMGRKVLSLLGMLMKF